MAYLAFNTPLMFSVELEGRFAYCPDDENLVKLNNRGGGEPVPVPPEIIHNETATLNYLRNEIKQALANFGCRVSPRAATGEDPINPELLHPTHYFWDVKQGSSIKDMPQGLENHLGCRWAVITIKSPVMWSCHINFNEIARVVKALKSVFRIIATPDCGLRVYVGKGERPFSHFELQRIAGLCFAASSILSALHNKSRHGNVSCASNRWYSEIATTNFAKRNRNCFPDSYEKESRKTVPRSPFPVSVPHVESGFVRIIPRGMLKAEPLSLETYQEATDGRDYVLIQPREIYPTVFMLLQCPQRHQVASLMSHPSGINMAYSFDNYLNENEPPLWSKSGVVFRQAAGTFNVDSIITWVHVCVRLCIFAIDERLINYWTVIKCCDGGEFTPETYDAFDLLLDLGLTSDAALIQSQILRRDQETPWQLDAAEFAL
ncbi:hypothetical protein F4779DRAFT_608656 [Xylariaceae sp. FL0662B]|nr:hypothetical protein F4779DRAFT_608656 [Xylariaceae sp. FL0662B]